MVVFVGALLERMGSGILPIPSNSVPNDFTESCVFLRLDPLLTVSMRLEIVPARDLFPCSEREAEREMLALSGMLS